jgi:hypothetical protein
MIYKTLHRKLQIEQQEQMQMRRKDEQFLVH